jgi:hypothetical protein
MPNFDSISDLIAHMGTIPKSCGDAKPRHDSASALSVNYNERETNALLTRTRFKAVVGNCAAHNVRSFGSVFRKQP